METAICEQTEINVIHKFISVFVSKKQNKKQDMTHGLG